VNNRERVIATLNHKQPDKIPYNIAFTRKARAKIAEYTGDPDFEEDLNNCLTCLGTEPKESWREVAPDIWEDQFGVRWNRTVDKDIGNVCNLRVTPENIDDYPFPDPDDPFHARRVFRRRHRLQPLRARVDAGRHGRVSAVHGDEGGLLP